MVDFKSLSRSKPLRIASVGVGGVVVLGAAAAVAQSLSSDNVIHGCVDEVGLLRVVRSAGECRHHEHAIEWNKQGVQGPIGLTGASGPTGATGAVGPIGATGPAGAPGPIGAMGPMGAMGLQGAQGLQGPAGRDGRDGVSGTGTTAVASACSATIGASANLTLFAKIDGIKGSATDAAHKGDTQLTAFGWGGLSNAIASASGSGAGAGKVSIGPACFVKATDAGTIELIAAAASGKIIPSIEFLFSNRESIGTKVGEADTLKITLTDAVISSYQPGAAGDLPGEELQVVFRTAEVTSCPVNANGTAGACTSVTVNPADSKI